MTFDWEAPPRLAAASASQPTAPRALPDSTIPASYFPDLLTQDPAMSQFTQSHQVPLTVTQMARRFKDVAPSHSITRFYSHWLLPDLVTKLRSALHELGIGTGEAIAQAGATISEGPAQLRIRTWDSRKQKMDGHVLFETVTLVGTRYVEVRFVKEKGDPLEWRRLFKHAVVLVRDAVCRPGR